MLTEDPRSADTMVSASKRQLSLADRTVTKQIEAGKSGEWFMSVNDSVTLLPGKNFYQNNFGRAHVTIKLLK